MLKQLKEEPSGEKLPLLNDASVSEKLIAANAVIGFAPTRTFVKRAQWAIDYTPITRDENSLEAEKKTISLARVNHE